ncbi:MAG: leucine-rich repeat domain-containing protein [Clostridia bacterium]|nr:leucine-rich repeat domain-containing protein [Clostridia bacterium]
MNSKIIACLLTALCAISTTVIFAACDGNACKHTFEDKWSFDRTNHWHAATCEHIYEKKDNGAHSYDGDVCSVCGFDKNWTMGLEYSKTEGGGYTVRGIGEATLQDGKLVIPSTHLGEPVDTISIYAFTENTDIKSVKIPASIKKTCHSAFLKCFNLESVIFEGDEMEFEASAFSNCEKLEEVILPDGVTELPDHLFYGCSSLNKMSIGGKVNYIGNHALTHCLALNEIQFRGTLAQWNAVEKDESWFYSSEDIVVICTDGRVTE